jgi:transcriptional regulator with XRE-family HTH domain
MGRVPVDLRKNVANNIRNCRRGLYPMWGGAKMCAIDFGVSPQQWSQWERGAHMPDEFRMMEIANFFGVSTAYLRRQNTDGHPAGCIHMPAPKKERAERAGTRRFEIAAASKIVDGVEVPLRVEVERIVYQNNYSIRTEKLL